MPFSTPIPAYTINKAQIAFKLPEKSVNTVESDFNILGQIQLAKCKIYPNLDRFGSCVFWDSAVAGIYTQNTYHQMTYEYIYGADGKKGNVDIYRSGTNKQFKVSKDGVYSINSTWCASIDAPATTKTNWMTWNVYKNGVLEFELNNMPMKIPTGVGVNYYLPVKRLNGSYNVYLTKNDYLELRFFYLFDVGGAQWDINTLHDGFLTIEYLGE